jgi:hypothetical protein
MATWMGSECVGGFGEEVWRLQQLLLGAQSHAVALRPTRVCGGHNGRVRRVRLKRPRRTHRRPEQMICARYAGTHIHTHVQSGRRERYPR